MNQKVFIVDTNVILHNFRCIYSFNEQKGYLSH